METTEKKLADLMPGDKVIFSANRNREIRTIKRVTPTRIILEFKNFAGNPHERQFHKRNGHEFGGGSSYSYPRIYIYTEEEEKGIILKQKKDKIERLTIRFDSDATHEFIDEVYNFLTSKGLLI